MSKIDKVVLRETGALALWMLIFSGVMQAVFLVIGKWDYTVLLGNLLSYAVLMLNFFLVGIMVQMAVEKDPKDARQFVKATGGIRMLVMFGLLTLGVVLDCFSTWTVIIPVFFPRVIMLILSRMNKRSEGKEEATDGPSNQAVTEEGEGGGTVDTGAEA